MSGRVLVVDDSATIRKLVRVLLSEAGHSVTEAPDGQQALELLQRDTFDLVLIDFVMPKLNGYQLAQALRAVDRLKTLPIVLMSAKADQIGERFIKSTGALDAITKPFAPEAIVTVVGHALSRRRAPEPATLVADEMHSQPRISPAHADGFDSLTEVPGGTGDTALLGASAKATVPDIGGTVPLVLAQAAAAQRFAEAIARATAPVLARALADRRGVDERTIMDAITHGITPAELASIARELASSHERELRGPVAIEGSLAMAPLGEVLQLLRLQQQTGLLVVQRRMSSEVGIAFHQGHIDLAVARNVSSEFLLGRYLIAEGSITRDALEQMLQQRGPRSGWLGEQLVHAGYLTREQLERALTRQTSEIIYEMLRWSEGRYRFEQGVVLPEARSAQLGLPVESIVLEGFRRVDEWRLMESDLGSFDEVLAHDAGGIEAVGTARLSRPERIVLDLVDGRRTIRDVIGLAGMNSFDACSILYRLLRARLLRRRAA